MSGLLDVDEILVETVLGRLALREISL